MAWIRKRPRSSGPTNLGQKVPMYSYRQVRNNREDSNRQIKDTIPSPPNKKPKKPTLDKLGVIIVSVIILVCTISVLYLSSSSQLKIVGQPASPIAKSEQAAVQATANRLFASSILNSNKITVNTAQVSQTLLADYPMFSNVSVALPLVGHHPVVYLTPAKPALVATNTMGAYLLNESGQVMQTNSNINQYSYLKLPALSYPLNTSLKIGELLLTSSEVQFIQTIIYELNQKALAVSSIKLPQGTDELDVYITGEPYYVKFNLALNNPREQAGSFLATEHYLKQQGVTPSKYVDVRVSGRVYYE